MHDDGPTPYSPFNTQDAPSGFALQGFYEELELTKNGNVDYEKKFLPAIRCFFSAFSEKLPVWSDFVNLYRHFIGLSYLYPQSPYQGILIEGFRFDFDLFYDPCWMGTNDLDINIPQMPSLSHESIFWMALLAFAKQYRCEGQACPHHFVSSWHKFLEISAVCYNSTAVMGDYRTHQVNSYEEVHRHYFPDDDFRTQFRARLREFAEEMIVQHSYFLPSHHFEAWIMAMEKDQEEYLTLLSQIEESQ